MSFIEIDDEIQKVNFIDENCYTRDKKIYYPSVTTVLNMAMPKSYGFYEWLKAAGQNADNLAEMAMNKGSKIHSAIELLIKGEAINWKEGYEESEWIQINKFVDFADKFKPKFLGTEIKMVSDSLRVGGTMDIPCILNDDLWIIDTKTGKDIYDDYALQLAAYTYMWVEQNKLKKIPRYGILWLNARTRTEGKNGSIQGVGWQLKELTNQYEKDIKIFKNVRENFDWLYPNWKPKHLSYPLKLKL